MGLWPSSQGYKVISKSVVGTVFTESAARMPSCLPKMALLDLRQHWVITMAPTVLTKAIFSVDGCQIIVVEEVGGHLFQ